jgi:hypothetical protein
MSCTHGAGASPTCFVFWLCTHGPIIASCLLEQLFKGRVTVIIAVIPIFLLSDYNQGLFRLSSVGRGHALFPFSYPSLHVTISIGVLCGKRRASLSRPTWRCWGWLWLTLMQRQWPCPLRNSSKSYAHGDSHRSHGAMHGRRPECTVLTQRFGLFACSSRVDTRMFFVRPSYSEF